MTAEATKYLNDLWEIQARAQNLASRLTEINTDWDNRTQTLSAIRGLPVGDINRPGSHRTHHPLCVGVRWCAALVRQVRAAGLSCRIRTMWQCWSVPWLSGLLSTLRPCSRAQAARRDEHEAVSFHHRTVSRRLVAPDVGDPQLVRFKPHEVFGRPGPLRCPRGGVSAVCGFGSH